MHTTTKNTNSAVGALRDDRPDRRRLPPVPPHAQRHARPGGRALRPAARAGGGQGQGPGVDHGGRLFFPKRVVEDSKDKAGEQKTSPKCNARVWFLFMSFFFFFTHKTNTQVSNHVSTLDDPALFAALVPWSINLRPHLVRDQAAVLPPCPRPPSPTPRHPHDLTNKPQQVRWSICSQEICFKNDALATFFGAGTNRTNGGSCLSVHPQEANQPCTHTPLHHHPSDTTTCQAR